MSGVITSGHVNVTPLQIKAGVPLTELRARMRENRYVGDIHHPGWGGITDDDNRLDTRAAQRPRGGTPTIINADDRKPTRLVARLYYDKFDRALARQLGDGVPDEYLYRLDAVDLILSHNGEVIDVLASTQSAADLQNVVIPALQNLGGDDTPFTVVHHSADGEFPSDFFFWILFRFNGDRQLTRDLELAGLRTVNSQDSAYRRVRVYEDAETDRREVLAMISNVANRYGPAKLAVTSKKLALFADFEIRRDGGFSPFIENSGYNDGSPYDRAAFGQRICEDLAYSLIPSLRRAWQRDKAWYETDRQRFIDDSKAALNASTGV